MDLSTIKKNIETGLIRTTAEFQRDIMLMFQNAVMYNSSDHDVYHMALEMQRDVLEQIQVELSQLLIFHINVNNQIMKVSLDQSLSKIKCFCCSRCKIINNVIICNLVRNS